MRSSHHLLWDRCSHVIPFNVRWNFCIHTHMKTSTFKDKCSEAEVTGLWFHAILCKCSANWHSHSVGEQRGSNSGSIWSTRWSHFLINSVMRRREQLDESQKQSFLSFFFFLDLIFIVWPAYKWTFIWQLWGVLLLWQLVKKRLIWVWHL